MKQLLTREILSRIAASTHPDQAPAEGAPVSRPSHALDDDGLEGARYGVSRAVRAFTSTPAVTTDREPSRDR